MNQKRKNWKEENKIKRNDQQSKSSRERSTANKERERTQWTENWKRTRKKKNVRKNYENLKSSKVGQNSTFKPIYRLRDYTRTRKTFPKGNHPRSEPKTMNVKTGSNTISDYTLILKTWPRVRRSTWRSKKRCLSTSIKLCMILKVKNRSVQRRRA